MAVEATPPTAGFASRGSNYSAKQARLEKDEKELEELMKGRTNEPEEVEEVEEEEAEAEAPEVQEDEEDDSNLSREEKSFKKRYGDLRRHMAEKEKEWKEKLNVASTVQSDSIRAPKSDEGRNRSRYG